jgi:DNA topoisomerase-2
VNGCTAGIGTGWSCNVPCYNPKDLIDCIKVWIENDGEVLLEDPDNGSIVSMFSPITPWYRGFKGVIKADTTNNNRFITEGVIIQGKKDTKEVTELPIGLWTNKFKEFCEDLVCDKKVKSMKNYSSTRDVSFILSESTDGFSCNIENMKLQTYVYTSNMVLFTEKNQLRKYDNVDQIIDNFCKVRLDYYVKRKKYQVNNLENEIRHLGNKERFIQEVIDKEILIMNEKEEDIIEVLKDRGYDEEPESGGYDYLLRLQVRTFTSDKVKQLKNDITSSKTKLDILTQTKPEQMWLNELNELEKQYEKWLVEMSKRVPKKKEGKK